MTEQEELLGADYCEHNVRHPGVGVTRAVSVLKKVIYIPIYNYVIISFLKRYLCLIIALFLKHDPAVESNLETVGKNKGHMDYLEKNYGIHMVSKLEIRNTPRPKSRSRNMNYEKM